MTIKNYISWHLFGFIKVSVTQKHIDEGVKSDNKTCPIALALKELGFKNPSVGCDSALIEKTVYRLPIDAENFIDKLDFFGKKSVAPFKFELRKNN